MTASSGGGVWLSDLQQDMDRLLSEAHVASPDELPGMVADAAALFGGEDVLVHLVDLQQRVLVPFLPLRGHNHDEFPHPLGFDSTVAGRAFQHMQLLTQSAAPRGDGDRVRVWLPLLNGTASG